MRKETLSFLSVKVIERSHVYAWIPHHHTHTPHYTHTHTHHTVQWHVRYVNLSQVSTRVNFLESSGHWLKIHWCYWGHLSPPLHSTPCFVWPWSPDTGQPPCSTECSQALRLPCSCLWPDCSNDQARFSPLEKKDGSPMRLQFSVSEGHLGTDVPRTVRSFWHFFFFFFLQHGDLLFL